MSVTIAFMTNYTLDIPSIEKQKMTIESFYQIFKQTDLLETFISYNRNNINYIKECCLINNINFPILLN